MLILGTSYQSNANKLVSKIEAPQEFEGVGHVRPEFWRIGKEEFDFELCQATLFVR
jgi:hypothetical protein